MAPALDLRLRQHLALTPQLQQALRLLQLSALEFAQEMGEAVVNNPFLGRGRVAGRETGTYRFRVVHAFGTCCCDTVDTGDGIPG